MALSDNLARVIGIVGLDRLIAHFAKRRAEKATLRPQTVAAAVLCRVTALLGALWTKIAPNRAFVRIRYTPAA